MKKTNLPEKFVNTMISLLGEEDFNLYEEALSKPMFHALRVNTSKISVADFLKIAPFHLQKIPWTSNGFYFNEKEDAPSKHPLYYAGLYYLQEPSAMVPASQLQVDNGDYVLDLCAAPGGKSTELASRIGHNGFLISNDVSASRSKALIKNLEIFGVENVSVTCEMPERLAEHFPGFFDKILIDAPCSGEGMFRKSSSMITAWEQNGTEKFSALQHQIVTEAEKMLRPGGTILYSTCTFEPSEDEEIVQYMLSLRKTFKVDPIKMYEGFEPGHPEWCFTDEARKNESLKRTAHLFPHKVNGEGHFVSKIKDDIYDNHSSVSRNLNENFNCNSEEISLWNIKKKNGIKPAGIKNIPEIEDFFEHVKKEFPRNRMELRGSRLIYYPEGNPSLDGLRVLRNGTYLGEMKKNRFEPSQSLAMLLDTSTFDQYINLKMDDPDAIRYLKGETLINDIKYPKGWILVLVEGYPLGFAKSAGNILKNKYLPGWRMA